jgi:hypothetical protein
MDEQGQNPVILPPQVIEKPTSVTVFGVLNCVFGGLTLVCTPFGLLGLAIAHKTMETTSEYKIWAVAGAIAGFGFAIWLLVSGIGLLMFKRWARKSSAAYAKVNILWALLAVFVNIFALSHQWINVPERGMPQAIGSIAGGLCGGLIYPILLLIFMQTAKVREAFAATGE